MKGLHTCSSFRNSEKYCPAIASQSPYRCAARMSSGRVSSICKYSGDAFISAVLSSTVAGMNE